MRPIRITIKSLVNGYDVGGRTLRVDRADQEMQSSTGYASANQLLPPPPPPPLISSTTSPSGLVSIESINATLGSMNNIQLLEVMTQMKVNLPLGSPFLSLEFTGNGYEQSRANKASFTKQSCPHICRISSNDNDESR